MKFLYKLVLMAQPRDLEAEVKEQARVISSLLRENKKLMRSAQGRRGWEAAHSHVNQQSSGTNLPEGTGNKLQTASPPHFVGAWQKFCPDCGGINPDFKDETVCTNCGMHLGSYETATKMKACPNCGGVKAKKIGK